MNYLDLLPDDVMNIINRKVQDFQIVKRRTERKENKRIQKEKKQIADNKRKVYMKYVHLYKSHEYLKEIKERVKTIQNIDGAFRKFNIFR